MSKWRHFYIFVFHFGSQEAFVFLFSFCYLCIFFSSFSISSSFSFTASVLQSFCCFCDLFNQYFNQFYCDPWLGDHFSIFNFLRFRIPSFLCHILSSHIFSVFPFFSFAFVLLFLPFFSYFSLLFFLSLMFLLYFFIFLPFIYLRFLFSSLHKERKSSPNCERCHKSS